MATHIIEVPFHIGDFLSGTMHMDATEVGAYWMLCVAHYQAGEQGLPDDDVKLSRIAKVSLKTWRRIRPTMAEKFTISDSFWKSSKVIEVLRKISQKSADAKAKALKRWEADDAVALPEQCPDDANQKPRTINQQDTNVSCTPLPPTDDDLLAECVRQYNVMAWKHGLSTCQVLSDPRKKSLRGRLKDCGGLDGWKVVLEIVAASDFLTGRKKDWKASLDFILQKSSFIKIMEGQYNNHKPSQQAGGGSYFEQQLEAFRAACQTFREESHDHSPYDDVRV